MNTLVLVGIVIYAAGFLLQGIVSSIVFGLCLKDYGRDDEDTKNAATIMISTPVWPLYWGKRLIVLIAGALSVLKDEGKEEK